MQLNQARQAAALALRNASMGNNEDADDDDEENDRRRHHGRRGGNRHKYSAHKRNSYHNQKATSKISSANNDIDEASGSNKR